MGTTPTYQLPYPESPDPADVPIDTKELAERLDAVLAQIAAAATPVGAPIPWLVSQIPAGYREFDGSAIVQATHPKLYALYGATIPDLRGRFLFGQDGGHAVGSTGGEAAHLLTAGESGMPSHGHPMQGVSVVPDNDPSTIGVHRGGYWGYPADGSGIGAAPAVNATQAHNTMPPYRACRWITVAG